MEREKKTQRERERERPGGLTDPSCPGEGKEEKETHTQTESEGTSSPNPYQTSKQASKREREREGGKSIIGSVLEHSQTQYLEVLPKQALSDRGFRTTSALACRGAAVSWVGPVIGNKF